MLILMNVEIALGDLGCTAICSAANVADALALIAERSFDAALLDVNLGGEKSYPVADVLSQRDIPFAFSTGYSDHGNRTDLANRPVLAKPFLPNDLVAVFRQLLGLGHFPEAK